MSHHNRGEFGFIGSIGQLFADITVPNVEGIGDDCAIIGTGDRLTVVTTDMLVEDSHFLRHATSPYLLGRKALAVNLSDVAAMGAQPTMSLLSLALPKECRGEWADEFMRGYHSISKQYGVALVGGDTTASKGAITINVVAFGEASALNIKRRGDALPGDILVVTDLLGESAAGLRDILSGHCDTPLAAIHKDPIPAIGEGVWLGGRVEVGAMMDISDGLASDICHIMSRSGVGARIDISQVPTSTTVEDAVCGGEDYKLLFTVRCEHYDALCRDFEARFGHAPIAVGSIIDGHALEWLDCGQPISPQWCGFRHF